MIHEGSEVLYVGMAGRNGGGSLRKRLEAHRSGQIVNMLAQYLLPARVQFVSEERITHPRDAKAACHEYMVTRCSFRYEVTADGERARELEDRLKRTSRRP